ncbi:hypothetical protein [Curtobacterium sp. MCPF17_031]|uniref:GAP1-N2 domain-containing protein n=1 Tax=Curtobacterium sp. MCPF17_031 TaxID=2175653 RepID=UPI000DA797F7|nr:hypothetical protein [Curtobacterium sp. MCPF17_031]PZE36483.1 hypothetical protein DEJ31_08915 [Curtobacterium sp. MCPF17_031]
MDAESRGAEGRWAQLTYASFDDGTTSGGWQVKETSGVLSDDELESLRSRVVTGFNADEPIPPFPTPTQVDGLARRFTYAPLGTESPSWAYWHAVQAGSDGSGRPGNVFSHVVLDRSPSEPALQLRPVLAWRSSWLAPFGPKQVLGTSITGNPVLGTGAIGVEEVVSFLTDPAEWRSGTLAVLLDAVRATFAGGPPVVLVSDTQESVAIWVAAVSLLMSAETSRRFSFSLYERAVDLDAVIGHGLHLVAVPRADHGAVRDRTDIVVIDDSAVPSLGDPGGSPHELPDGSTVPASAWSVMAQVALADAPLAAATLRAIDEVTARVGDSDLAPEWPLAMVTALRGGELLDAEDEAAQVLADHSPIRLRDDPELWAATADVLADRFGTDPAAALAVAGTGEPGERLLPRVAARVYAERALADRSWLARPGSVPVPVGALGIGGTDLRLLADAALGGWAERTSSSSSDESAPMLRDAVEFLHLLDLIEALGLGIAGRSESGLAPSELLMETIVAPLLVSADGPTLVEQTGPVRSDVRSLARAVTASMPQVQQRPIGRAVLPVVLDWLYRDDDRIMPDRSGHLDPLDRERVIAVCRSGRGDVVAGLRHLVFVEIIRAERQQPAALLDRTRIEIYQALQTGRPWTVEQVAAVRGLGVQVPDQVLARALGAAPDGPAFDDVLRHPISEAFRESDPIAAVRRATRGLQLGGAPGDAAVHAGALIELLSSAGTNTDLLEPIPEVSDPVIAAVALTAAVTRLPVSPLVIMVAERLAVAAGEDGVRRVLDTIVADVPLAETDVDRVVETFVRSAAQDAALSFPRHEQLAALGRMTVRAERTDGRVRVTALVAAAVLDGAEPSVLPGVVDRAAQMIVDRKRRSDASEREIRSLHQDAEQLARRLLATWHPGAEPPIRTRPGLLGRMSRNEVN